MSRRHSTGSQRAWRSPAVLLIAVLVVSAGCRVGDRSASADDQGAVITDGSAVRSDDAGGAQQVIRSPLAAEDRDATSSGSVTRTRPPLPNLTNRRPPLPPDTVSLEELDRQRQTDVAR
jgi:hypothetical protein